MDRLVVLLLKCGIFENIQKHVVSCCHSLLANDPNFKHLNTYDLEILTFGVDQFYI